MSNYRLRPSKAEQWGKCPGYLSMSARYPELPGSADNTVREEGTAAHWAAYRMSCDDWVPVGEVAPNGVTLTKEMVDGAQLFLDTVRSRGVPVQHELTLLARSIHEECGGTSDAFSYDRNAGIIYVDDFKFGYRFVDVFENWQLAIYASSILDYLGINGYVEQFIRFQFTIVQPRSFGGVDNQVRTWTVKATDLRNLWNRISTAAYVTSDPNAPLKAGAHCLDCSARYACPALRKAGTTILDCMTHATPNEFNPSELGVALDLFEHAGKIIKAINEGLRMQAEYLERKGAFIPGWSLRGTAGNLEWNDGAENEVIQIAETMHLNIVKPRELITPTQAIKLLGEPIVKEFATRKPGALKLTRVHEKTVRSIFEGN